MSSSGSCRLCAGETEIAFRATVRDEPTDFLRCADCESLQIGDPHWLKSAYEDPQFGARDTGAVERCLRMQAAVVATSECLGLPRDASVLDFGGGSGLLCRLLRDAGLDAWVEEPYAPPVHARPFTSQVDARSFDLVTMIEVVEHLLDPDAVFGRVLSRRPRSVLISTEIYAGQGEEWWYLSREDGQHVFFYSSKAMERIAKGAGYAYASFGGLHLLTREALSLRQHRRLASALRTSGLRRTRIRLARDGSYAAAERDLDRLDAPSD